MSSKFETQIEEKIKKLVTGRALEAVEILTADREIKELQEYANHVSIQRLKYNDHGPVHMRKVALNALIMVKILHDKGKKFAMEKEHLGKLEDVQLVVFAAAFLHDIGMGIGREGHEVNSTILAESIIKKMLQSIYPEKLDKQVAARCLIMECVLGHMATREVHTSEAGVVLIADGCDMEQGRARIPMRIQSTPEVGDIHQYSADSILKVDIKPGKEKPIAIHITMNASVGFFQVEEVLFPKINMSPVKKHLELYAGVKDRKTKQYL